MPKAAMSFVLGHGIACDDGYGKGGGDWLLCATWIASAFNSCEHNADGGMVD